MNSDFSDCAGVFVGSDVEDMQILLLPPWEAGKPVSVCCINAKYFNTFSLKME